MRGQEAYTQIRVQAHRCRWGCRHLLCLCQCHSAYLGQCQDGLLSFLCLQKTHCPHPLFVSGSSEHGSCLDPMNRGCRRLLLTQHVMQDAGWHMDQNPSEQVPRYQDQSRCSYSAAVGWNMFSLLYLVTVDQWGKIFFGLPFVDSCVPKWELSMWLGFFCFGSRES